MPVSKIVPEQPNTVFTPLMFVSTNDDRCLRIWELNTKFPLGSCTSTGGTTWLPSATFSTNMKYRAVCGFPVLSGETQQTWYRRCVSASITPVERQPQC